MSNKGNPFDYVKSINEKNGYINHVRDYNAFLTNMSLSYSLDTLMLAQEMNQYPRLPALCQYDFLYQAVRKGRRFNKWFKEENVDNLEMVMDYYSYSKAKALEALQILTPDQLAQIKASLDKGGR